MIAVQNRKWSSHFGRESGSFLQNLRWHLLKQVENMYLHKNLHTKMFRSFIHNRQKLKITKEAFSRRTHKLWHNQIMKYYSVLKITEPLSYEKTWMKFKYLLLSERIQKCYILYDLELP